MNDLMFIDCIFLLLSMFFAISILQTIIHIGVLTDAKIKIISSDNKFPIKDVKYFTIKLIELLYSKQVEPNKKYFIQSDMNYICSIEIVKDNVIFWECKNKMTNKSYLVKLSAECDYNTKLTEVCFYVLDYHIQLIFMVFVNDINNGKLFIKGEDK